MMTPRQRLRAAIRGEERDRVPVTPLFMQWAAHRIGRTYREYYLHGERVAEAQLAVAEQFGCDMVCAISDPWSESDAYGRELTYPDEAVGVPGPPILNGPDDIERLRKLDPSRDTRLAERVRGIEIMRREAADRLAVVGWVEGPIAQYADLRELEPAMMDLMDDAGLFDAAVERIVENAAVFAEAQIDAGADIIGIGDAAASLIGPELYRDRVLTWQTKLIERIHDAGALVKLHICGNIAPILADMAHSGADVIDVDWMVPLAEARRVVGPGIALCGNIDPAGVLLRGTPEQVAAAARACLNDGGDRFILSPGCEVPPGTPEANLRAMFDAVRASA